MTEDVTQVDQRRDRRRDRSVTEEFAIQKPLGMPSFHLRSHLYSILGQSFIPSSVFLYPIFGHSMGHTFIPSWVTPLFHLGSHCIPSSVTPWVTPLSSLGHTFIPSWVTLFSIFGHTLGHTFIPSSVTAWVTPPFHLRSHCTGQRRSIGVHKGP